MKNVFLIIVICSLSFRLDAQAVKTGLVGYWSFTGNAKDSSLNANHGTVYGATLTTDRFGNKNAAYHFDGENDYIHIGNKSVLKPASVTINVWFRNLDTNRQAYLFGCSNAGYGEWGVDIHQRKLKGICSALGAGASNRHIGCRSGNWYADTSWHMATLTYDAGNALTCSMYVDTVYLGSPNSVGSSGAFSGSDKMKYNSVDSWYFGVAAQFFTHPTANNGPFYFKGDLDDGGVYNRALTFLEIKKLYEDKGQVNNAETNTEKVIDRFTLTLYPNPTTGIVKIGGTKPNSVMVYNSSGSLVLTKKNTLQVDLKTFPAGIYYFQMQNDQNVLSQVAKVVKN